MTGRIYLMGEGVKTDYLGNPLSIGDRVVFPYYRPCGRCPVCMRGEPASCPHRFLPNWLSAETPPHFNGGYAEYYYLVPGQPVFKVPDDLPDEYVAPVNCALSQVLYSLIKAGLKIGDRIVIQGAGGLGIYASAVAREMGAERVIVIDKVERRLALAREFGADEVINMNYIPESKERVKRIRELTRIGADYVLEVTGSPDAIPEGISMLRQGGTYIWVGNISLGFKTTIDPALLVLGNRKVLGIATYDPAIIPRALDFLRRTKHKYPYFKLLSHKFKLEDIDRAFEMASKGEVIRAAIVFD